MLIDFTKRELDIIVKLLDHTTTDSPFYSDHMMNIIEKINKDQVIRKRRMLRKRNLSRAFYSHK